MWSKGRKSEDRIRKNEVPELQGTAEGCRRIGDLRQECMQCRTAELVSRIPYERHQNTMKNTKFITTRRRLREIMIPQTYQTVEDPPAHDTSGNKFLEELQLYDAWQDEQTKGSLGS